MDYSVPTTESEIITKEFKSFKNRPQIIFIILTIVFLLALFGLVVLLITKNNAEIKQNVSNFEECSAAGNPILETYPEQCKTKDGRTFVKVYN